MSSEIGVVVEVKLINAKSVKKWKVNHLPKFHACVLSHNIHSGTVVDYHINHLYFT